MFAAQPHYEWLSAEAITAIFAVAPETLELYRVRGTLRSILRPDGARMFDAMRVAEMFRPRGSGAPLESRGPASEERRADAQARLDARSARQRTARSVPVVVPLPEALPVRRAR